MVAVGVAVRRGGWGARGRAGGRRGRGGRHVADQFQVAQAQGLALRALVATGIVHELLAAQAAAQRRQVLTGGVVQPDGSGRDGVVAVLNGVGAEGVDGGGDHHVAAQQARQAADGHLFPGVGQVVAGVVLVGAGIEGPGQRPGLLEAQHVAGRPAVDLGDRGPSVHVAVSQTQDHVAVVGELDVGDHGLGVRLHHAAPVIILEPRVPVCHAVGPLVAQPGLGHLSDAGAVQA